MNWTTHSLNVSEPRTLLEREWLLTNGTGAYAAGTAAGVNTRRYHALLVACEHPPVGRIVALTQMLEQVQLGGKVLEFSSCLFPGDVIAPAGMHSLTRFERGLAVTWRYHTQGVTLERSLHLHWKQQAATLGYRITTPGPAIVRLSPLLTLRDFHGICHQHDGMQVRPHGDTLTVTHDGHAVTLRCRGSLVKRDGQWWRDLRFPLDAERGQEDREDAFLPGTFEMAVDGEAALQLTIALGEHPVEPVTDDAARATHLAGIGERVSGADKPASTNASHVSAHTRHPTPDTRSPTPDTRTALLAIASDDFIVDRTIKGKRLSTIMAGYPWFSDWGRDTFIALPGLLLTAGRFGEARAVLQAFAEAIRNGLVPNRFDDYDDTAAHYNTVDASLWYIHAALEYVNTSGDYKAWDAWLAGACRQIIEAYLRGTDFDIRCGGDGLITAGGPGTQLTWMDAACGGVVFTPRHGKAVEINALWHSALVGMAERFAESDRGTAAHYNKLAGRVRRAFAKVFWNDDAKCLFDHVWQDDQGQSHIDASIRPNQIFAASLARSPLPQAKQKHVVACVERHLLTPYGLRTLPESDGAYHAEYRGEQMRRDEAYHQGTIWPWLIGAYAEAVLRTGKFSDAAKAQARAAITPLLDFMHDRSIGQLYEIHEAQPPHRPVGCFAQAWSVAEVLRIHAMLDS